MRERCRHTGIRIVVGGHVDGLDGGDRAFVGRRDALFESPHFRSEGRLVAHRGRHAAEKGRDFHARERVAVDVVDEEKNVLPFLVTEIFGDGKTGKADAQADARRLVHLSVNESRLLKDTRLLHLEPEIVPFTGALAHTGEHRETAVLCGDVVDELHDDDRLAHTGAAEKADFAAADIGLEEIDDLDAGLEHLELRALLGEIGRRPVDGKAFVRFDFPHLVDGLAENVQHPSERFTAHGNGDGGPRIEDVHAAYEPVRRLHRHRANAVLAEVLLDFNGHLDVVGRHFAFVHDAQGVVDRGKLATREFDIDDVSNHLDHASYVSVFPQGHSLSAPLIA